jgi:DNA-binding transcriptional LysR family regulator
MAIRAFESFCRLQDVTLAAQELGITSSAISHQLKALDESLGLSLTERTGRRLSLTAAGRNYAEAIGPAFALLYNATALVQEEGKAERLSISALPLVAIGWLVPRLEFFLARHPEIEVDLHYTRHRSYGSDAADLSLRYGFGEWPNYSSERLLAGDAYPVASPALLKRLPRIATPADLVRAPLLHDGKTEHWSRWFAMHHGAAAAFAGGMVCEDGLLIKSAVMSGLGIGLARPLLIKQELERRELAIVLPHSYADGQDYYLCVPSDRQPSPGARKLAAWLRRYARDERPIKQLVERYLHAYA